MGDDGRQVIFMPELLCGIGEAESLVDLVPFAFVADQGSCIGFILQQATYHGAIPQILFLDLGFQTLWHPLPQQYHLHLGWCLSFFFIEHSGNGFQPHAPYIRCKNQVDRLRSFGNDFHLIRILIFALNISGDDSADGPHGLVAGMTGSGKSEAIVSYLLALTTFYSPLDLSLVIIDFKGGAMCNKFRGIPHLVGSITNLADKEIDRSLKTLDAELKHRQQLLQDASDAVASHDIDNINKYTKLFKAGRVKEPMPHMLIVVDEFAELKAQYPDFLKKLVSAARIGRSLGVHLILATQKPAGQVSDQIWSNSKFRICLKVQTEQDSKEVIKSDLAAKIKEAGHAYLMVGNNERFEFFQSGYSGAPDSAIAARKESTDCLTQFNAVVNHITEFCRREKIEKMPDLFMEPLPEQAVFPPDETEGDAAGTVAIGIYDDPEHKTQGVKTVSLVSSNLMIIGSSQMGKGGCLPV